LPLIGPLGTGLASIYLSIFGLTSIDLSTDIGFDIFFYGYDFSD
jgi:hypothetical protein